MLSIGGEKGGTSRHEAAAIDTLLVGRQWRISMRSDDPYTKRMAATAGGSFSTADWASIFQNLLKYGRVSSTEPEIACKKTISRHNNISAEDLPASEGGEPGPSKPYHRIPPGRHFGRSCLILRSALSYIPEIPVRGWSRPRLSGSQRQGWIACPRQQQTRRQSCTTQRNRTRGFQEVLSSRNVEALVGMIAPSWFDQ